MKKHLRIFSRFVSNTWQRNLAYRLGQLMWIINGMITPLILMNVWLLVRQHQQLSLGSGEIITYYLLIVAMQRLTQTWTAEDLAENIKKGNFSNVLIKPMNFVVPYLGKDVALKCVRLISLLPFFIVFLWIFRQSIILSPIWYIWILGLLAIVGGYVLNLFLELSLGLITLWFEDGYGVVLLVYLLSQLFNGFMMPIDLLPTFWQNLAYILPFRFLIGFPIELLMGRLSMAQIGEGFLGILFWIVVFFILHRLLLALGIKKYSAVGQ
jgi:ABC-2 type transport system permease protein